MNKLEPILRQKELEVAQLRRSMHADIAHPLANICSPDASRNSRSEYPGSASGLQRPSFKDAMQSPGLSIIAEIKRKSPSKGVLAPITDVLALAKIYYQSGAHVISILTDQTFFAGHIDDLKMVATKLEPSMPLLRKDFIIDKLQIAEAALAGASAILLIVAVVGKNLSPLLAYAHSLKLDVLVEVHDAGEIKLALESGASIIGINNRNLKTFSVNHQHALQLIKHLPADVIKIAESGICEPALARAYYQAGFDAVLIGEALVIAQSPQQFIEACHRE